MFLLKSMKICLSPEPARNACLVQKEAGLTKGACGLLAWVWPFWACFHSGQEHTVCPATSHDTRQQQPSV